MELHWAMGLVTQTLLLPTVVTMVLNLMTTSLIWPMMMLVTMTLTNLAFLAMPILMNEQFLATLETLVTTPCQVTMAAMLMTLLATSALLVTLCPTALVTKERGSNVLATAGPRRAPEGVRRGAKRSLGPVGGGRPTESSC